MSCRKKHEIGCCCECEYQLEIHVCSCGHCSKVTGYICLFPHIEDGNYLCTHKTSEHGLCELFQVVEGKKEKPATREDLVRKLNAKLNQR